MNIIHAIHSRDVFLPLFKNTLQSWRSWEVYLHGLFGLGIQNPMDLALFKECTGLERPPAKAARESIVICGRRSGKSFIAAIVAVFLSVFVDWSPYLSPGERGWIFIIAVDKAQAGIIKDYISRFFHEVKCLRSQIVRESKEEIELRNGISIGIKTASFRSVRGYTLLVCILEELAFYRSDESANPDKEILAAVRPALATVPKSMLIGISTPYSRRGVLWEQFKNYFGTPGGAFVWKAPTRIMNPTIDRQLIENALREDPQAARAEWEAEWREDIEAFISPELVDAVMVPRRFELPRVEGIDYVGFVDPSGGRQDSFTLAIAHKRDGRVILDVLRERRPPFQPKSVVIEFSEVLKSYGVRSVNADRYAGEWVAEAFRECGVEVGNPGLTASEIYINFLPMVANGTVELLDNARLKAQLVGLERRKRTGGRDLITHFQGQHDDVANCTAGACVRAKVDEWPLGKLMYEANKSSEVGTEEEDFESSSKYWLYDKPQKKTNSQVEDEAFLGEMNAEELEDRECQVTILHGWRG